MLNFNVLIVPVGNANISRAKGIKGGNHDGLRKWEGYSSG